MVSTLRHRDISRLLVQGLSRQGYSGKVAVSSTGKADTRLFQQEGVDLVLVP